MTGEEIKNYRNDNGLRQKDCAEIIGVGIRQWQKYEQGYPIKQIYVDVLQQVITNSKIKHELNSPT